VRTRVGDGKEARVGVIGRGGIDGGGVSGQA
jgi:hypothetical protein